MEQEKTCSKCGVSKPLSEFYKEKRGKYVVRSHCKSCYAENDKARNAKHRAENAEKEKARKAKYHAENAEKEKARKAKYYAKNAEKEKARKAKYHAENAEKVKASKAKYRAENAEKEKARSAEYYAENAEATKERTTLRRRGLRNQKIAKTFRRECAAIRKWARDCQELTGTEFHVDHICPVKAKVYDPDFDCYLPATGLHVPWNLDPKPANHNLRKSNRVALDEILHTPTFTIS